MFQWWQNLESVAALNSWMHVITIIIAAITAVSIYLLWTNGNHMIRSLIEREQHANKRIKAVEAAAEQIRKELLATQQNQDIADQKRRLAEMDADALRKEMTKIRKRYTDAEGALKDRIEALKDFNITQSRDLSQTSGAEKAQGFEAIKKVRLNDQQLKTINQLLASGPKGELDIIAVLDNASSNQLANQLMTIFNDHGWTTKGIIQSAFSNPPEDITLVIHSKQTAPSYAKFLQKTLTTIGFPVSAQINSKYREWSISMIVGQID